MNNYRNNHVIYHGQGFVIQDIIRLYLKWNSPLLSVLIVF